MEQSLRGDETRGEPPARGRWPHGRARLLEAAYVLAVAGVAAWGFTADSTAAILAAVVLALPCGIPALVGYYVAYGLLALVPGANPSSGSGSGSCTAEGVCQQYTTGDLAPWFAHTADVVGILALNAAAAVNVMLLRLAVCRRRGQKPSLRSCFGSRCQSLAIFTCRSR
jgi:hypothetical protein